jgi:hypothetical protein
MLDCSRNAVMKVNAVKELIRKCALMGLNSLQLYTEDTYEVGSFSSSWSHCHDGDHYIYVDISSCIMSFYLFIGTRRALCWLFKGKVPSARIAGTR